MKKQKFAKAKLILKKKKQLKENVRFRFFFFLVQFMVNRDFILFVFFLLFFNLFANLCSVVVSDVGVLCCCGCCLSVVDFQCKNVHQSVSCVDSYFLGIRVKL